MTRWMSWWRFANVEQLFSFVLITLATIGLTSMLAHSTLFGVPGLPNDVSFLRLEAQALEASVGRWFAVLFLAVGTFSLFGAAMGTIDYTSRLAADILKSTYMPRSAISESQLYFWLVWGIVALGCGILLSGPRQPITLLVISACTAGTMMFMYSILLIALNRSKLPAAIRIRGLQGWSAGVGDDALRVLGSNDHLPASSHPVPLSKSYRQQSQMTTRSATIDQLASHRRGMVARGGIEPPTRGFSVTDRRGERIKPGVELLHDWS